MYRGKLSFYPISRGGSELEFELFAASSLNFVERFRVFYLLFYGPYRSRNFLEIFVVRNIIPNKVCFILFKFMSFEVIGYIALYIKKKLGDFSKRLYTLYYSERKSRGLNLIV